MYSEHVRYNHMCALHLPAYIYIYMIPTAIAIETHNLMRTVMLVAGILLSTIWVKDFYWLTIKSRLVPPQRPISCSMHFFVTIDLKTMSDNTYSEVAV